MIPILVGPTGSGKTAVALETARLLSAEIISADSRQIYRHLQIGTAKPQGTWAHDERHPLGRFYDVRGVPHHLMDFLEPTERYDAGLFSRQAGTTLQKLLQNGRTPILAGGTGLYLRALVDGLAPLPPRDEAFRKRLAERAGKEGRKALHEELSRIDPESARSIPPNNIARVVRAIEVHALTGRPISWWQKEKTEPSPFAFRWIGLLWPKEEMEKRLADRCREMTRRGFLEETETLIKKGVPPDAPAFQSLGYRSAIDFLQGRLTKQQFQDRFVLETRQYVKRQMTWFRANKRIHWLPIQVPFDPIPLARALVSSL
ncbi:MAG: tRNA (adenosine(37)-N6)-dimethylallyltransferase MiaA [Elusimicrobia bacterium]|nr:tRNA (adenosine(37)-N6)-dimethylallyltransferase MiaA [Elusimicrobiota bacterium]